MTSELDVPKEDWKAIKLLSGKVKGEVADFFSTVFWESYCSREIEKGSIQLCEYL